MSKKPYILIAEDELLAQQIYDALLSDYYEVKITENGKECLLLLKNKTPDILLLDVNMPLLNGYEVCKVIRRQPQYKSLPIIFVSALTEEKDRKIGMDLGANDYLTKPFDDDELFSIIKKHL